ncbi:MAG TPA: serine/threonine-protein kinase [Polyangia bacterium]|jgi:serine/threonine-protein kinase|nr:serine/threonine-protein kinase [Polyangia bacterium]
MLGQTVGSYKILEKIGEGGMGEVYLAEHPLIGKKAAVKVLLPQYSAKPDIVARFFNEARAVNLIKHPSIVDIFDFGQHASGSAYIVMEYLEGESLSSKLRREGRLRLEVAIEIVRQLAGALGAAHEKGIAHRDLKPDNIYLVPMADVPLGLRVKVLDFGIAKLAHEPQGVKTATNALLGTPAYMSPEQCRGAGHTDHRSDIYSLGAILFEMVCGRVPFVGEGPGDIIIQHVTAAPPAPRSLAPEVPPTIERVILRALEKKAEDRYQTMAELARDLDPTGAIVRPMDVIGASAGAMGARDARVSTTLSSAATQIEGQEPVRSRRSPGVIVAAMAGGLAILGGGAWLGLRNKGELDHAPAGTASATTPAPPSATEPPIATPKAGPPVMPITTPAKVKLQIDSLPQQADVIRASDGVVVGRTPTVVEVERSDGKISFRLRLGGYRDEVLELDRDHDGAQQVKLAELPRSKPATAKTASPPATKRRAAEAPKKKEEADIADPFAQ